MIVGDLQKFIAAYSGRTAVSDLTLNGIATGLVALNTARRKVEKLHDFKYSRAYATLSIASTGSLISASSIGNVVTVTGTQSPDARGTYIQIGTFDDLPLYFCEDVGFFIYYDGSTGWLLANNVQDGTNSYYFAGSSNSPAGTYVHLGTYTGSAVATFASTGSIKRVTGVQLPIAASNYRPIEFLTSQEWNDRIARQIGRSTYVAADTIAALGIANANPIAYQQGQSIYIVGSGTFTFPITARLEVVRFMPDYSADTDHDFFCDFGAEYLQWAAILELNKHFKQFIPVAEGSIPEAAVEKFADEALQALIKWDNDLDAATSTPPAAK